MYYAIFYPDLQAAVPFSVWDRRPIQQGNILYIKECDQKDDYTCSYQFINEQGEPYNEKVNTIEATDINSRKHTTPDNKSYRGFTYYLRDIKSDKKQMFFFSEYIDDLTELHLKFVVSLMRNLRELGIMDKFDGLSHKRSFEEEHKQNEKLREQIHLLEEQIESFKNKRHN